MARGAAFEINRATTSHVAFQVEHGFERIDDLHTIRVYWLAQSLCRQLTHARVALWAQGSNLGSRKIGSADGVCLFDRSEQFCDALRPGDECIHNFCPQSRRECRPLVD